MSLPNNFMIKDIGVTTKKNINPITIGEIKFPRITPILNQILFNGVSISDFNIPKTKKIIPTISDQILKSPFLNKGKIEIIKKKAKKTIPKLLFEPIFISWLFK